jgi:hypothetical protein
MPTLEELAAYSGQSSILGRLTDPRFMASLPAKAILGFQGRVQEGALGTPEGPAMGSPFPMQMPPQVVDPMVQTQAGLLQSGAIQPPAQPLDPYIAGLMARLSEQVRGGMSYDPETGVLMVGGRGAFNPYNAPEELMETFAEPRQASAKKVLRKKGGKVARKRAKVRKKKGRKAAKRKASPEKMQRTTERAADRLVSPEVLDILLSR